MQLHKCRVLPILRRKNKYVRRKIMEINPRNKEKRKPRKKVYRCSERRGKSVGIDGGGCTEPRKIEKNNLLWRLMKRNSGKKKVNDTSKVIRTVAKTAKKLNIGTGTGNNLIFVVCSYSPVTKIPFQLRIEHLVIRSATE